jgi:hypothetical protein
MGSDGKGALFRAHFGSPPTRRIAVGLRKRRPRFGQDWLSTRLSRAGVRANFRAGPAVFASTHEQPVPIFQQLARGHPSGRDDVRAIPLSSRNVDDPLVERGIDVSHETVVSKYEDAAEVQLSARPGAPPIQSGAPSSRNVLLPWLSGALLRRRYFDSAVRADGFCKQPPGCALTFARQGRRPAVLQVPAWVTSAKRSRTRDPPDFELCGYSRNARQRR